MAQSKNDRNEVADLQTQLESLLDGLARRPNVEIGGSDEPPGRGRSVA